MQKNKLNLYMANEMNPKKKREFKCEPDADGCGEYFIITNTGPFPICPNCGENDTVFEHTPTPKMTKRQKEILKLLRSGYYIIAHESQVPFRRETRTTYTITKRGKYINIQFRTFKFFDDNYLVQEKQKNAFQMRRYYRLKKELEYHL